MKRVCAVYDKAKEFWDSRPMLNRWFALGGGVLMMLNGGNQYAFSTYSSQVRAILGWDIERISLLGTTQNIASYAGVLMGTCCDLMGPNFSVLLAGYLAGVGYLFVYLGVLKLFRMDYWVYLVLYFCIGSGSILMYFSALYTNIRNFDHKYRGIIVGFLVSFFGVSGSFFGLIFKYVLSENVYSYLLFVSVISILYSLYSFFLLNVQKDRNKNGKSKKGPTKKIGNSDIERYLLEDDLKVKEIEKTDKESKEDDAEKSKEKSVSPCKMLLSLEFYLLFVMMFAGVGTGLILLNQAQEIVISLSNDELSAHECTSIASTLVVLAGIANASGRIVFGVCSDWLSKHLSRTGFLTIALFIETVGLLMCSFLSLDWFYVTIPICIFAYGGIYSTAPSFASERFYPKWFSLNFSIIQISCALGSLFFATYLSSLFFEIFSTDGGISCYGYDCFRVTFMISAIITSLAVLCGLCLHRLTKKHYEEIYEEKTKKKALKEKKNEKKTTINHDDCLKV